MSMLCNEGIICVFPVPKCFFVLPEGKFLVTNFDVGGSFDMSLEGDCHEVEVTPNLELLVNFGMSLEGACHDLINNFTTSSYLI
jgi:hypothetical protein